MINQITDRLHDNEIGAFVAAADVISLAHTAALKYARERPGVIVDIKPIANILAVAINWQRLICQALDDHVRDQLFWEVIGAVIV